MVFHYLGRSLENRFSVLVQFCQGFHFIKATHQWWWWLFTLLHQNCLVG